MKRLPVLIIPSILLLGCTGPSPHVLESRVLPPQSSGGPYWVEVELLNKCSGAGEIKVDIRLKSRSGGFMVHQEEQLELRGNERIRLRVPVQAPPGAYEAEVRSEYPIS